MYVPMRDDDSPIQIRLPWDKNTARGFAIALALTALILLLSPVVHFEKAKPVNYEINSIPIELLSFGMGDGTGVSKGNLTEEGEKHLGKKTANDLEDAEVASKTANKKSIALTDPAESSNLKPVGDLSSNEKNNQNGSSARNTGSPNGKENGTGLGDKGYGKGLGSGLGDIEWGGGGNRVVLYKKLPKYPNGVNTAAQIRIKFVVSKDGTVTGMYPLQKGEPSLERAAMDALRQWRFNPLKDNKDMYGIITFTFRLS